jgi:hypothetical protein
MKMAIGALAGLAIAASCWAEPAAAQGVPQGSYLRSCSEVQMRGDSLVAYCRRPDGRAQWSWINEVRRCVGDIANAGGNLACRFGTAQAPPPPPYGAPNYGERRYGEPGYGSDWRARCEGLRREAFELRERIQREWNPIERARMEGRLQEVHQREERCR